MKSPLVLWLACAASLCVCLDVASAETQVRDCPNCVVGIYDDAAMTRTDGRWPADSPVKRLWVGIQYDADFDLDGLTGLEISIDGLHGLPQGADVSFEVKHEPTVVFGNDIRTPPPTAGSEATGGINAAWNKCVSGDEVLVELFLFSLAPLTEAIELRVRRRFPASDPAAEAPLFTDCNPPIFEKIVVTGGSYTLGPVAVEGETWSTVKQLYR